jgi:hypothetical protein
MYFWILGCLIWIVGLSPSHGLPWQWKRGWIVEDGYQYGDLYRLSNLSEFQRSAKAMSGLYSASPPQSAKKVHLYVIGDSFTEKRRVEKKDFPVDEVHLRKMVRLPSY